MNPPSPQALVTDGLWRKSLSAIRSLGKSGHQITVLGDSTFTTGFWSAYCAKRVKAPLASKDPAGFGAALFETLRAMPSRPTLFPMEDPSLAWVSENRDEVSKRAHLLLPPIESLRIAQDKASTLRIAAEAGIPHPLTREPQNAAELASIAQSFAPESFVVKPRSGTGSAGVIYGERLSLDQWRDHWERYGELLIQERVPSDGRGLGVSLLMDRDGECVAQFAHERLEQYPNSGGPSTDRRAIHAPELVEMSIRLLKRLHWRGIAMVEWKADPRGGAPKLMEINPRFWGSLELAVRAGVDFPSLYARAARGEKLPPPPPYPAGTRCRWMIPGEFLRYASKPRHQRESVLRFLKGLPGMAEEWDLSDLRGTLATLVCTGALALNPRYWKYIRRG